MRLCVSCVYWTLLLVSVVSSGLLFIIVASEGIELSEKANSIGQEGKTPSEDDGQESRSRYSEPLDNTISDLRSRPTVKTEKEHLHPVESNGEASGHEAVKKESDGENNLNFLKQSLTSQPNLSQGISETGQAVVLTLVDTAAAELQSLAEPRLSSDIRSKSLTRNTTLRTTTTESIPVTTTTTTTTTTPTTATTSTTTSSKLTHDELSEQIVKLTTSSQPVEPAAAESSSNVTKVPSIKEDATESPATVQDLDAKDKVPIVRAEQKPFDETTATKPEEIPPLDEIKDESVGREENSTTWAESDDGWSSEKLVGGSGEESSNVISDDPVTSRPIDDHHEDMPSFSEWAQKRLEEAEKKKTHPNASVQNPGGPGRGLGSLKVRSKNYASPDCGAKIVAVNPEARSARSVLVSTRDEYMLNTCTSRIWFVVELCEAIQAKKIELANFELFSSSPKDFSVYVSDRFPTRDWSPVGQFTAKDERDIQSFQLHPHLFGKFIKVETHSHHGSEHFCPISLFRAYGTSEFEVLETETDHQEIEDNGNNEDEEDEPLDAESDVETRNLFGSARDAVLRIVKKAAEVLVKASDLSNKNNITKIQESIEGSIKDDSFVSCMTPRYTIDCANCTDNRFAGVFELLNCRAGQLDEILRNPFVNETLRSGEVCASYGLGTANTTHEKVTFARIFRDDETDDESSKTREFLLGRNSRSNFLTSIYSPEYIVALCNVIATKERRLVLNTSYELSGNLSENSSTRIDANGANFEPLETNVQSRVTTSTCLTETDGNACKSTVTSRETKTSRIQGALEQESSASGSEETTTASSESLASQIKPTKALGREDMRKESSLPILEPSKDPNDESVQAEVLTTASPILNVATATSRIVEEPPPIQTPVEATVQISTTVVAPSNAAGRESQDSVSGHENSHENGGTPTRQDNNDQEYKSGKSESNEQEAKFIAQDQMSFDSILSDLKDLETDGAAIHGNSNLNANVVAQPTTSSTPQQKESVFLRLSNRIKALERNMSLSGQYLEELSKRYKKQVEEMQRSLERATAAMSEESRKGEERELRRIEEISALRDEITSLTKSMEILLYDRNSWRSKLSTVCQHFALVVVEIVVFISVVSYCRRNSEFEDIEDNVSSVDNEVTRRRSAGAMTSCGATKKTKKRRPSEIASRIGGTYRELMIDDHRSSHETKKDKKKRRKRELNGRALNGDSKKETVSLENDIPGGTALPSRRSSSTDSTSCHVKQLELFHKRKRPDSAPEYSGVWIDSSIIEKCIDENIEIIDDSNIEKTNVQRSLVDDTSRTNFPTDNRIVPCKEHTKTTGVSFFRGGSILKAARLSSPSFMKTALGSRSKRSAKQSEKIDNVIETKSDDWEWYSKSSSNRSDSGSPSSLRVDGIDSISNGQGEAATKNGHNRNPSNESESGSSTTATSTKKEKRTGQGLRKMCEGRKTLEMLDVRHSQRVVGL